MKDLHWFIIFAALLVTPFLPSLLRSKCPGCSKRKLQSLETVKIHAEDEPSKFTYITMYKCDACKEFFKRNKSGALQPSTNDEHRMFAEAAVNEIR